MRITYTGINETVQAFESLDSAGEVQQRLASPALIEGAREFYKLLKRRNYGFTDRTGDLRGSLRILTGRASRSGRFVSALEVTARTRYAAFVEFKRRTRDRRPGPPYWFGRALAKYGSKVTGRMANRAARTAERILSR